MYDFRKMGLPCRAIMFRSLTLADQLISGAGQNSMTLGHTQTAYLGYLFDRKKYIPMTASRLSIEGYSTMFSAEAVVSWFRGIQADERIHVMCLLLDCCLPCEVRFLGTYLEAIAQKDYQAFRQAESNANNPAALIYLDCLENVDTVHELCVSLALLHASNRQAAAVIFSILNKANISTAVDGELSAEYSLLLNMSVNHPAFSFQQKYVLRSTLNQLMQYSNITEDSIEVVSDLSPESSTFYPDQDPQSKECSNIPQTEIPVTQEIVGVGDEQKTCTEDALSPEISPPVVVFVKELKLLGIKKRDDNKPKHESKRRSVHEYVLEVTWGDEKVKTLHKSYEDMFDFQCKLRKMYPTKVDEHGQPWKLPFLPGRIRLFNKPEQKGEKTPIPDIADYSRLFGSLPKFVRGCDHVVRFFHHHNHQSWAKEKKSKVSKRDEKAGKSQSKRDTREDDNQLDSPHKIAEAVREQSLSKDTKLKTNACPSQLSAKPHDNKISLAEKQQKGTTSPRMEKKTDVDENGNHVVVSTSTGRQDKIDAQRDSKLITYTESGLRGKNGVVKLSTGTQSTSTVTPSSCGEHDKIDAKLIFSTENGFHGKNGVVELSAATPLDTSIATPSSSDSSFSQTLSGDTQPFHPQFSIPLQTTLQMYDANGFHSSLPSSPLSIEFSTNNTLTSSYPPSLPSPTDSMVNSPVFHNSFSTGYLRWGIPATQPMSVRDWLKSLRLHKYSELIQKETFDDLLRLSDADLDQLGMTAGARRRLSVNLETLRTRGCFTSNGTKLVDILQAPPNEASLSAPLNCAGTNGSHVTPRSSTSGSYVGYNSDTDFVHSWSESDSAASECSSDPPYEYSTQATFAKLSSSRKAGLLNGWRLSCYNCGSLGHVGGQCMAPNMDRAYSGYHLTYDEVKEC